MCGMSFSYLYPSHIRVVGVQGNNDLSLSLPFFRSFYHSLTYTTVNKERPSTAEERSQLERSVCSINANNNERARASSAERNRETTWAHTAKVNNMRIYPHTHEHQTHTLVESSATNKYTANECGESNGFLVSFVPLLDDFFWRLVSTVALSISRKMFLFKRKKTTTAEQQQTAHQPSTENLIPCTASAHRSHVCTVGFQYIELAVSCHCTLPINVLYTLSTAFTHSTGSTEWTEKENEEKKTAAANHSHRIERVFFSASSSVHHHLSQLLCTEKKKIKRNIPHSTPMLISHTHALCLRSYASTLFPSNSAQHSTHGANRMSELIL